MLSICLPLFFEVQKMSYRNYLDCCRFCLNKLKTNSNLELHEYFYDLYNDITGKRLTESDLLSKKFCFECNDVIAKMTTFIKNQEKLSNLLLATQPSKLKLSESKKLVPLEQEYYDVSLQAESLETVIVKEEQMFAFEEVEVKVEEPPDDCEVIAIEDSSDDEIIELPNQERRKKLVARPPKPKKIDPESERFCPYDECQKLFSSKHAVQAHIAAVHEKIKKFRCKLSNCGYSSYQRNNVVAHQISIHKLPNPKTYFCELCGIQCPSSNNLRLHRISKHLNVKNYQCDCCGLRFRDKQTLRQHVLIHMLRRKMIKCDFPGCDKTFYKAISARIHKQVVHERIMKYECHCGKKFAQKQPFQKHQRHVHEKIKEGHCEICDKWFSEKNFLKYHMISFHSAEGERPSYPCEICGQTFASVSILKNHQKVHGEPQFSCEHCSKNFYRKSYLLDHMEHHTKLAFPCPHCKRSFRTDGLLNHHFGRVHFKKKQTYRCEICSSTFTRRTTCRDHVLRQHKGIDPKYRKDLLERISKMLPEEKMK